MTRILAEVLSLWIDFALGIELPYLDAISGFSSISQASKAMSTSNIITTLNLVTYISVHIQIG